MNIACRTVRCFIREAAVQRTNTARRRRASGRVGVRVSVCRPACLDDVERCATSVRFRSASSAARHEAISRTPGCDRGQRASGPASVSSVDLSCLAVEIRTVCDSCRFVTSLTVLSIPAPQRVPRRREKRAPAIRAAAASADARPVRAPRYERVRCRLSSLRASATRAPRPCGLRRTCDDDAVRPGRPTMKIRQRGSGAGGDDGSYLVDPASSHMLVSKIKPCMSKHKPLHGEAANGSLGHP